MTEQKQRDVSLAMGILKQRFGDKFLTGDSIREQHGHTTTYLTNQPPDAVVYAQSAEDVQWVCLLYTSPSPRDS